MNKRCLMPEAQFLDGSSNQNTASVCNPNYSRAPKSESIRISDRSLKFGSQTFRISDSVWNPNKNIPISDDPKSKCPTWDTKLDHFM